MRYADESFVMRWPGWSQVAMSWRVVRAVVFDGVTSGLVAEHGKGLTGQMLTQVVGRSRPE